MADCMLYAYVENQYNLLIKKKKEKKRNKKNVKNLKRVIGDNTFTYRDSYCDMLYTIFNNPSSYRSPPISEQIGIY